ncbi:hypothetical protein [Gryllotalpicola koreensis]|uniref:Phage tail protein n=1 Tax=Gryllotalpicola koreensis TaxID=993086 RepID=A0ABP8A2Z7_9MICO
MAVQARFYVRAVEKYAYPNGGWAEPKPVVKVQLSPVSGNKSDANKAWASATPSGAVELTVGNPDAAEWFEQMLGKDVAITFDERPADELQ